MPFAALRSLKNGPLARSLAMGGLGFAPKLEYDDTIWFTSMRSRSIQKAKEYFLADIERYYKKFGKLPEPFEITPVTVGPGRTGYGNEGSGRQALSEGLVGDPMQSQWEEAGWLGAFDFYLGPITRSVESFGTVEFNAEIRVVDRYGLQEKYSYGLYLFLWSFFGEEYKVTLARIPMKGSFASLNTIYRIAVPTTESLP